MSGDALRLRLRVLLPGGVRLGPGKADLLEAIARTGSIAAAGRDLGMSYKRAWTLVEEMNAVFAEPVVSTARGGAQGGGAALTEAGARILALYRAMEAGAARAAGPDLARLEVLLRAKASRDTA